MFDAVSGFFLILFGAGCIVGALVGAVMCVMTIALAAVLAWAGLSMFGAGIAIVAANFAKGAE